MFKSPGTSFMAVKTRMIVDGFKINHGLASTACPNAAAQRALAELQVDTKTWDLAFRVRIIFISWGL
jgi:hypothetical protein